MVLHVEEWWLSVGFLFTIMDMSGYVKAGIPHTALRHRSRMYTYLSLSCVVTLNCKSFVQGAGKLEIF